MLSASERLADSHLHCEDASHLPCILLLGRNLAQVVYYFGSYQEKGSLVREPSGVI